MLSKVFEWSRVAHPAPTDDFVTKRSGVVQALADEFAKKPELLLDCACAAAGGVVPRFTQDSDLVSSVIEAIRNAQPATPEALSENAVEVRSCCALVVGEVAHRAVTGQARPSAAVQAATAAVSAALINRPLPTQQHLRVMLSELLDVCTGALQRAAEMQRQRYSLPTYIEGIAEAPDVPAFWKAAKPNFTKLAQAAEANAQMDREEIDTLWWAFNGVSTTKGRPFVELAVGDAAICAGLELANRVLIPPLATTKLLTHRILASGRRPPDVDEKPLRDLVGEWDAVTTAALTTTQAETADFVRNNPAILPLSWLSLRMKESGDAPLPEFKRMTGWDAAQKTSPNVVARQAFEERVLQRMLEER